MVLHSTFKLKFNWSIWLIVYLSSTVVINGQLIAENQGNASVNSIDTNGNKEINNSSSNETSLPKVQRRIFNWLMNGLSDQPNGGSTSNPDNNSPSIRQGYISGSYSGYMPGFRRPTRPQMTGSFGSSTGQAMGQSMIPPMGPQMGPAIGQSVGQSMIPPMGPPMGSSMGQSMMPPMGPPMGPQMGPQMGSSMGQSMMPPMGPQMGPAIGQSVGQSMIPPMGSPMGPPMAPPMGQSQSIGWPQMGQNSRLPPNSQSLGMQGGSGFNSMPNGQFNSQMNYPMDNFSTEDPYGDYGGGDFFTSLNNFLFGSSNDAQSSGGSCGGGRRGERDRGRVNINGQSVPSSVGTTTAAPTSSMGMSAEDWNNYIKLVTALASDGGGGGGGGGGGAGGGLGDLSSLMDTASSVMQSFG